MIVLIDGKEVKVQNDVKIIYDGVVCDLDDDDKDIEAELHVTLTSEGIVTDVINSDDGGYVATMSRTYGELADDCI